MKKIILLFSMVTVCLMAQAQEEGKFRVGWNVGGCYLMGDGFGVIGDMDVRYNIVDNINAGIRFGGGGMMQFDFDDEDAEMDISINTSILAICDYYIRPQNSISSFAPFVGAGFGYYILGGFSMSTASEDDFSVGGGNAFGLMVRTGFEASRFRLAIEYNIIPPTNMYGATGEIVSQSKNSYIGLLLGVYVGGGKWGVKSKRR